MEPIRQSSTALKFVKSMHQRGKLIRTIGTKILIDKTQGRHVTVIVDKMLGPITLLT